MDADEPSARSGDGPRGASDDPWFELAHEIRARRRDLGLSQAELAAALHYSKSTVSNWESGRPVPPEVCAELETQLALGAGSLSALHPTFSPVRELLGADERRSASSSEPLPGVRTLDALEARLARVEHRLLLAVVIAALVAIGFMWWTRPRRDHR